MNGILLARELLHGSDTIRAIRDEHAVKTAALRQRGGRRPMWEVPRGAPTICIGTDHEGHRILMPISTLLQQGLLLGPTGAGKTAHAANIVVGAAKVGQRSQVVWGNSKPDIRNYVTAGLSQYLAGLAPEERESWLNRVVVLAPGSATHLVPLQILHLEPGMDAELLVADLVESFFSLVEAQVGVRQEDILADVLLLLVELDLPITFTPTLLGEPLVVSSLAAHSKHPDRFHALANRLTREGKGDRVAGIVARLKRLLRLEALRLMFGGARGCVDFGAYVNNLPTFVFVDLSAEYGAEVAVRFAGRALWNRFVRTLLTRPIGSSPVVITVDEFQELLAVGADVASGLERCLRVIRARGGYAHLCTQTLAGLEKYASSLPEVLRVNTGLRFAFRGADPWEEMLPVTGCHRRPAALPWESRRGSYYLSRSEEVVALRAEMDHLEDRRCLVQDTRTGRPAIFMRTADAVLAPQADCPPEILDRLERGNFAVSVAELEHGMIEAQRRFAALAGESHREHSADIAPEGDAIEVWSPSPADLLKRRAARPVDIG